MDLSEIIQNVNKITVDKIHLKNVERWEYISIIKNEYLRKQIQSIRLYFKKEKT